MTRVEITDQFKESVIERVYSVRVANRIEAQLVSLRTIPTLGSNDLPKLIIEQFGGGVRKIAYPPFLIIYEYDESDDVAVAYDLIHERQAY